MQALRAFVRRPSASLLVAGLAALGAAAVATVLSPAIPLIHDEFSYLLQADTFLHGRLGNPPLPYWRHFDTMHVLQQPTYASKYPPLQGAILALGVLVAGRPYVGVWISFALACAALVWMLRAFVPPGWALTGGLLVALAGQPVLDWGVSYWGGAGALLGGALVYGAGRRLLEDLRAPRARALALWLGAGLALLSFSRPFEGAIASLPLAALLGVRLARRSAAGARARVLLPLVCALALTGAANAYYDYRVTGSPWTLPYVLHARAYFPAPEFLFLSERPRPSYSDAALEVFHVGVAGVPYRERRDLAGFLVGAREKFLTYWTFFPCAVLSLSLLGLVRAYRDRWVAAAGASLLLVAFALLVETYERPHYAAPALPLLVFLLVRGAAEIWKLRPAWLWRALVAVVLAGSLAEQGLGGLAIASYKEASPLNVRAHLEQALVESGGKHLVLVRYRPFPHHNPHEEWVYNGADLDAAPVIFARELAPERNRELIAHFADRTAWLLRPDLDAEPGAAQGWHGRIDPYPAAP